MADRVRPSLRLIEAVRAAIAPDDAVLCEARERRDVVARAALQTEGSLRSYPSGSLAHGTANRPVDDADGGVVLDRRSHPELGPDGGGEGPARVVKRMAEVAAPAILAIYPKAEITFSRRGLLVYINEPLPDGQDPSVDMITTLTRKDAPGLWIADLHRNGWTPSHPEKHTELFLGGGREQRVRRARVVRLAKAWNTRWNEDARPLSSFNIAALAWECTEPEAEDLDYALLRWFEYSAAELAVANTKDPAGVSPPIRLLGERDIVVRRLRFAGVQLRRAIEHPEEAQAALAEVFSEHVNPPANTRAVTVDAIRRDRVGSSAAGLVIGGAGMKPVRSYGDSTAR